MINVLIFSDSLTIYIVSGCQLLTFFEKKTKNWNIKLQAVVVFFDYNSVSSSFSRKSFPTLAGITFLLQQEALSAQNKKHFPVLSGTAWWWPSAIAVLDTAMFEQKICLAICCKILIDCPVKTGNDKTVRLQASKNYSKSEIKPKKNQKNAAFTEKLSPDRNGAERSKGGKVFRPLNGA